MKKWWWLITIGVLQAFDVLITLGRGLENEGNPLVVRFGFLPFVTVKVLNLGLFIVAFKICTLRDFPRPQKVFKVASVVMIAFLALGCGWNLYAM